MEAEARFAASAYKNLAQLKDSMGQQNLGQVVDTAEKNDFGGMVTSAMSQFVDQARSADVQGQAMAAGQANLVDVVTAVTQTQVAMETLVSVRDQVISAYEKIMQMPV